MTEAAHYFSPIIEEQRATFGIATAVTMLIICCPVGFVLRLDMPFFIVSCIAGIIARVLLHTHTHTDTRIDITDTGIQSNIHTDRYAVYTVYKNTLHAHYETETLIWYRDTHATALYFILFFFRACPIARFKSWM